MLWYPAPAPAMAFGNIQRDVKVRLDAVVVAAAVHAGVAILRVFVYALYIERVQILVDGQRDRLADGVLRTAADGLLDELFRHAGDLCARHPLSSSSQRPYKICESSFLAANAA